jgi:hypothetical protein
MVSSGGMWPSMSAPPELFGLLRGSRHFGVQSTSDCTALCSSSDQSPVPLQVLAQRARSGRPAESAPSSAGRYFDGSSEVLCAPAR